MSGFLARLTAEVDGQVSSAVLMREATRTSRRWQTYAARSAFSGVLFGVLLFVIWIAVSGVFSTADLSWLGRGTFIGFTSVQILLSLLLAPLMTSQAIIEELEDRTLETLILTRLQPAQILGAKVMSRIMLLLTIVLGALPVMTLVVTLGGVSAQEVIAVTAHTALTVVITGCLGAFFALFTRSPFLAMFAAAAFTVPTYSLLPMAYAMSVGDMNAAVHLSPIMGPQATGWDALLPVVAFAPVVFLIFRIGTPLFKLKVSNAHIRHSFDADVWKIKEWLIQCGVLFALGIAIVPAGTFVCWALQARGSLFGGPVDTVLRLVATGSLFVWWSGLLYVASWVFLRLGIEIVDPLDSLFGGGKSVRSQAATKVWNNPVAWREARPRAWGSSAAPILFTWTLVLLGLVQTGWWLIPGGLLTMGLLNASGALLLTLWLSTHTIEGEVRNGTLEVLLATTMPSWKILGGKVVGVASPTLPLILLSAPMLILGVPHMKLMDIANTEPWDYVIATAFGLGAWIWLLPLWAACATAGIAVALRMKRRQSSFGTVAGALFAVLAVAAIAGRLFPTNALIAVPARLLAPPLAGGATWWQLGLSTVALTVAAMALFAVVSRRIRPWAAAVMALLLAFLSLVPSPAQAQQVPAQDNFIVEARPLADGLVRSGTWSSVHVTVENKGRAAQGQIQLMDRFSGTVQAWTRPIELAEGARKEVLLYYRPSDHNRPRKVVLDTPGRHAEVEISIRPQNASAVTIGVVGDDPLGLANLSATHPGGVPGTRGRTPLDASQRVVRSGVMPLKTLPGNSAAYRGFDWLVWPSADPSKVGEREVTAISHWVADGGHLFISVTDNWRQLQQSPLADALPVRLDGLRDADLTPLLETLHADPRDSPTPIATGQLSVGPLRKTWTFATSAEGDPLWVAGTYGLGTVHLLLVDTVAIPLSSEQLWRSLLWLPTVDGVGAPPRELADVLDAYAPWDCFYGGMNAESHQNTERAMISGWEAVIRDHLSDIPGAAPLPMSWLLVFSALYLLVIGPGDYFLLKWMGRQPLTWITFPVSIAVFSTIALVGTSLTKGSKATVVRVEVVDKLPGTDLWRGTSRIGVFATRKTDLKLTSGYSDGVISPQEVPGFMTDNSVISSEGPGALTYRAETWTLGFTETDWIAPLEGDVRLAIDGDDLTLESTLPFDLEQAYLGSGEGWIRLDGLKAGERRTVTRADAVLALPSDDWAFATLYEFPEKGRGHLHLDDYRWVVVGTTARPIEPISLEGLTPEEQPTTLVRIAVSPLKPNLESRQ